MQSNDLLKLHLVVLQVMGAVYAEAAIQLDIYCDRLWHVICNLEWSKIKEPHNGMNPKDEPDHCSHLSPTPVNHQWLIKY